MMGFTFLVGFAFAYVLKLMTLFFSLVIGGNLSSAIRRNYAWGRTYCMNVARSYDYIRSVTRDKDFLKVMPQSSDMQTSETLTMDNLAEYHFGTTDRTAKQDTEMNRLYEFHYGKI